MTSYRSKTRADVRHLSRQDLMRHKERMERIREAQMKPPSSLSHTSNREAIIIKEPVVEQKSVYDSEGPDSLHSLHSEASFYSRNMHWKRKKEEQIQRKQEQQEEMSLIECKFTPAITKYSFSRSSASDGGRSKSVVSNRTKRSKTSQKQRKQDDMYYKNITWKEEVNKKRADMQLQKQRLIESTLKFKPTTNESSEKRNFQEFYNRSMQWRKDKEIKKVQLQGSPVSTFKPLIMSKTAAKGKQNTSAHKPPIYLNLTRKSEFKFTDVEKELREFTQAAQSLKAYFMNQRTMRENYNRKVSIDSFISEGDSFITRNQKQENRHFSKIGAYYSQNRKSESCSRIRSSNLNRSDLLEKASFINRALYRSRISAEENTPTSDKTTTPGFISSFNMLQNPPKQELPLKKSERKYQRQVTSKSGDQVDEPKGDNQHTFKNELSTIDYPLDSSAFRLNLNSSIQDLVLSFGHSPHSPGINCKIEPVQEQESQETSQEYGDMKEYKKLLESINVVSAKLDMVRTENKQIEDDIGKLQQIKLPFKA